MASAGCQRVVVTGGPAEMAAAACVFPSDTPAFLSAAELRPATPCEGRLFDLFADCSPGDCLGLVVPLKWLTTGGAGAPAEAEPTPPAIVPILDHVNLVLRGPLTGVWPAGRPRSFPSMSGVYQPGVIRARGGARVYSPGVVVAGVADSKQLTEFESRALFETGLRAVSDALVPVAIVAAFHGVTLAACGVPQAHTSDRE